MRKRIMLLVAACFFGGDAIPRASAGEPAGPMEGSWSVVAITMDGIKATDRIAQQLKLIVRDNRLILKPGLALDGNGKVVTGNVAGEVATFKLDSTKTPGHIDISFGRGTNKNAMKGIYIIEKGELKICFSPKVRPTDFDNAADSGHTLIVAKSDKS